MNKLNKKQILDTADKEFNEHKKSLASLKESDPEFYKFLQQEDASLLEFGEDEDVDEQLSDIDESESESDIEEGKEDGICEDEDEMQGDNFAMVDGEENPEAEIPSRKIVTEKMIDTWEQKLSSDSPSFTVIKQVMSAFSAAVNETSVNNDAPGVYKLQDPKIFNEVVRLCFQSLFPAISKAIGVPFPTTYKKLILPSKSEKWHNLSKHIRHYLINVIQLSKGVAEQSLIAIILRHIKLIHSFYLCFPKITFKLIKHLIEIWSTSDDEVNRVICFFCLHKLAVTKQDELLNMVLKRMYSAFVKNSKFTSPLSWPMINFMQRCFIELCTVDLSSTYHQSFLFIRQLAITLRAAIREPSKEKIQAVYNWQFIHCLHLWSKMLTVLCSFEELRPLIYPLTQIIIGTIRLNGGPKFYPLRFQCVRCLIRLSSGCDVYIPVLPFLLEVLNTVDFNKKPKSAVVKKLDFTTVLKFSNMQLEDKSFRDGLLDEIYELVLSYLVIYAHHLTFPELILPVVRTLKRFVKNSKVPNHTKVIKNLLERIQENAKEIDERRLKATIDLKNKDSIDQWLRLSKQKPSPFSDYYKKYSSLRQKEIMEDISGKDFLTKTEFPLIMLKHKPVATENDKKTFVKLFDDNDEENVELFSVKKSKDEDCPTDNSEINSDEAPKTLQKTRKRKRKIDEKKKNTKKCILDEIPYDSSDDEVEVLRFSDIDSAKEEKDIDMSNKDDTDDDTDSSLVAEEEC